ncbi:MAG TPA: YbaN family protein [Anaerolineales bacterium]
MHPLLRFALITVGTISVALGVVGVFVPILPTTPFLLLAAACYARSSDRFLHWLLHNRLFGAYIRNYREGRGMPRSTRILTIAALWLTLGLSAAFAVSLWWVRGLLAVVGIGVTLHLLRMRTYTIDRVTGDTPSIHPVSPASDEP